MRRTVSAVSVVICVVSALLFGAQLFILVADRNAGWPHGVADLEGRWVLDRVEGRFESPPPAEVVFTPGSAAGIVRVSDGQRSAEFSIQGIGRLVFAESQHFEPLLATGASEVYTMTHLCPSLPAWDHLCFYPDGMPVGQDSSRRLVNYERE